jgi:hypothetical protein
MNTLNADEFSVDLQSSPLKGVWQELARELLGEPELHHRYKETNYQIQQHM